MRSAEAISAEDLQGEPARDNPFPGLRPFLEEDKDFFFGRDGQVVELLGRLRESRFLALLGTSGSGKSSLVHAGLFPALHGGIMRGAGSRWQIAEFRPGSMPLRNLGVVLVQKGLFRQETNIVPAEGSRAQLEPHDPFLEASVEATLRRSSLGLIESVRMVGLPKDSNLLVVVDQFEELFRFRREALKVTPRDDAQALVRLLIEATRQTEFPIYVAITLRSEFLGECGSLYELPEAINRGQYLIPRLSRDERRLAIEGPVSVAGGAIRPRLVQRLLNDAGDNPDQLPILQHALMRTWNAWKRDHAESEPLDLRHYEAIHGLEALSLHAEEIFAELPAERHRGLAEKMFKALTKVDSENRGIRNPANFGELCALTAAEASELRTVIDAFRKSGRTFLMPPIDTELQPGTIIDLSHESLMRVWVRLRAWTREEAQSARMYLELAKDARAGKSLYRDPELAAALKWQEEDRPNKAWGQRYDKEYDLALEFLERSRRAREAQRWARIGVVGAIMILLAAVGAFYLISYERGLRERSAQLRAYAVGQLTVDPQESVALASMALMTHRSLEAEDVLREALFASSLRAVSSAHSQGAVHVSFVPDGRSIVSAGADGKVCVWKWQDGGQPNVLARHSSYVNAMAFRPAGTFVATADVDGVVVISDLTLGNAIRTNKLHDKAIETVTFHPTENLILTASQDGSARIWHWQQGDKAEVRQMPHPDQVTSAEFSPDGNLVLTACRDGAARIWDWRAQPPRESASLNASKEKLKSAHFDSKGTLVVTAGLDGNIRVWNWRNRAVLGAYAHGESSRSAVFHPDGHLTLSVGRTNESSDDVAVLSNWASRTNREIQLQHPGSSVESAAFSQDGAFVVTTGVDGTARVWSTQSGAKLEVFRGHSTQVDDAAFHPNGTNIVTACHDGQVRVWEFRRGHVELFNLTNGLDAAVSPDGRYAAMWRPEGAAWLAPTASTNVLSLPTAAVEKLVFTPDSQGVILVSREAVSLWKIDATGPALQWTTNLAGLRIGDRAALSSNGEFAVTSAGNGITFWTEDIIASTHRAPALPNGQHWHAVIGVTADPKGSVALLTVDHENALRLWSLKTNESRTHTSADVLHLAFSPDDQSLLHVSKELTSRIWDLKTKKIKAILSGYGEQIDRAAFSPNGKFVVAGSHDHLIHLWSSRTGHRLATFQGDEDRWRTAEFTPDGLALIAVSDQGKVWTIPCEELSEDLKTLVPRRILDTRVNIKSKYLLGR